VGRTTIMRRFKDLERVSKLVCRRAGPSGPAASPGLKPRGSERRDSEPTSFETRSKEIERLPRLVYGCGVGLAVYSITS
jgi:hypothetical protein